MTPKRVRKTPPQPVRKPRTSSHFADEFRWKLGNLSELSRTGSLTGFDAVTCRSKKLLPVLLSLSQVDRYRGLSRSTPYARVRARGRRVSWRSA